MPLCPNEDTIYYDSDDVEHNNNETPDGTIHIEVPDPKNNNCCDRKSQY